MNYTILLQQRVQMISFQIPLAKMRVTAMLVFSQTKGCKGLLMIYSVSGSMSPHLCDSTTPDNMIFDLHILTPEASGEDVLCSSQNINDSIVVSACQKRGGNRVYDKRHYCLCCSKPYAKMARHLERAHENKPDVAKALSFPKGSKERRKQLDYIRNRGNFANI